jgi:hypothetical protein
MNSGTNPSVLHDRATRGETLSSEDQAVLDAWYGSNDQNETNLLEKSVPVVGVEDLASLRTQVNNAQQKLSQSIERVLKISEENENLRREIEEMRNHLLAHVPQTA